MQKRVDWVAKKDGLGCKKRQTGCKKMLDWALSKDGLDVKKDRRGCKQIDWVVNR